SARHTKQVTNSKKFLRAYELRSHHHDVCACGAGKHRLRRGCKLRLRRNRQTTAWLDCYQDRKRGGKMDGREGRFRAEQAEHSQTIRKSDLPGLTQEGNDPQERF